MPSVPPQPSMPPQDTDLLPIDAHLSAWQASRRMGLKMATCLSMGTGLNLCLGQSPSKAATADAPTNPVASSTPDVRPPTITPDQAVRFPQDFGAHPAYRTEWWYITGSFQTSAQPKAQLMGFQITFFRTRVDVAEQSHSRFATRQLVFAHAALTDLQRSQLLHDQRIARAGFGLAQASEGDTQLSLRNWHLQRSGPATQSRYQSHIAARDFTFDLSFTQTQPVLLQGEAGFSRKGPRPIHASHYYSQPHLTTQGQLTYRGQTLPVQGEAWLDHEWGETLMDPDAAGWDWVGMNLSDGSALTAFRVRDRDGHALWHGGSLRKQGQATRNFGNDDIRFTPEGYWVSPATGTRYPVQWRLDLQGVASGPYTVRALLDSQELDSRFSTGNIYWEGLSVLLDAHGHEIGRGYLEMTGYASAMTL